jgi:pSer/pThr/pTyr-binding forkhead associated (FHA) protein
MMISKDETVIGRAEGIDIGLYGEQGIEKQHARIVLKNNNYYLVDNETPGGTFLNGQRVDGRTPLKNGDRIQVGTAVLRWGERPKRK